MTVDPDEVRFELERLSVGEPGRLELTGRWFGIRGRRFVRPTLLLTLPGDDAERRSLADLEHKPWAAEEGEAWTAAFPVDAGLRPEAAASIELSVAPDITVRLAPGGRPRRRRAGGPEPIAEPRRRERSQRVAGDAVGERERIRRQELMADRDRVIEERDQAMAERDQAIAMRDRRRAERDRAIRAGARAESSLRERVAELEAANQALADARAESARLRAQLAAANEPRPVSGEPRPVSGEPRRVPGEPRPVQGEPRRVPGEPRPAHGEPRAVAARADSVREPASGARAESPGRAESPYSERPRNPSLRLRANWFVRLLTVLVILGVIAAILLVVRTTIAP